MICTVMHGITNIKFKSTWFNFEHHCSPQTISALQYLRQDTGLGSELKPNLHVMGPGQPDRCSDSLRAEQSEDRIQLGARLTTPVRTDPGVHLASYKMGTWSFPGLNRMGRRVNHPPPPSFEVKGERVCVCVCVSVHIYIHIYIYMLNV
jgi:hypothetical protein